MHYSESNYFRYDYILLMKYFGYACNCLLPSFHFFSLILYFDGENENDDHYKRRQFYDLF